MHIVISYRNLAGDVLRFASAYSGGQSSQVYCPYTFSWVGQAHGAEMCPYGLFWLFQSAWPGTNIQYMHNAAHNKALLAADPYLLKPEL